MKNPPLFPPSIHMDRPTKGSPLRNIPCVIGSCGRFITTQPSAKPSQHHPVNPAACFLAVSVLAVSRVGLRLTMSGAIVALSGPTVAIVFGTSNVTIPAKTYKKMVDILADMGVMVCPECAEVDEKNDMSLCGNQACGEYSCPRHLVAGICAKCRQPHPAPHRLVSGAAASAAAAMKAAQAAVAGAWRFPIASRPAAAQQAGVAVHQAGVAVQQATKAADLTTEAAAASAAAQASNRAASEAAAAVAALEALKDLSAAGAAAAFEKAADAAGEGGATVEPIDGPIDIIPRRDGDGPLTSRTWDGLPGVRPLGANSGFVSVASDGAPGYLTGTSPVNPGAGPAHSQGARSVSKRALPALPVAAVALPAAPIAAAVALPAAPIAAAVSRGSLASKRGWGGGKRPRF